MPSKESELLYNIYKNMVQRGAAYPNMDLDTMRLLGDEPATCASEPTNVTYENIETGGIPAIWAKPTDAADDRAILYFHGGAFAMNSASSHRKLAGHLAKHCGTQIFIPDYRRAPEHQFPAQLDDALAAYRCLLDQGYEPGKIATAGDSAGGNLAVTTVLKARDEGLPLPSAIICFSAWVDMEHIGESLKTNAELDALGNPEGVQLMIGFWLGEQDRTQPLANPIHADLTGMPPMYLNCGTHEVLQSNTLMLAENAQKAGLEYVLDQSEGMQHVYVYMAGRAPEADDTLRRVAKWLKPKMA